MDQLTNPDGSFNIVLLDQAVGAFLTGTPSQEAQNLLISFQESSDSWLKVDIILDNSKDINSKLLSLNILDNNTKSKWKILPTEQREGIKLYLINLIIKLSSNELLLKENNVLLKRLNLSLVQILKQDWPHNWPNFISDLVTASKQNESLCTNNMHILKLLSEEVFDYSALDMTKDKMKDMKNHLNKEFGQIFDLCYYILENTQNSSLLLSTLGTLLKFLSWIPIEYILETKLIEILVMKFFPFNLFQNVTLRCMCEIANLTYDNNQKSYEYNNKMIQMFVTVISQTNTLITPDVDVAQVHKNGNNQVTEFLHSLAVFICNFLKSHVKILEELDEGTKAALLSSLQFLLRISHIEEVTLFKICLEYWTFLVTDLYNVSKQVTTGDFQPAWMGISGLAAVTQRNSRSPRLNLYFPLLSPLRMCLIGRMAKPEEVLIVEDENGEIIREPMRDTDSINLYKSMRECLVYLTHLDPNETQEQIAQKLSLQDGPEWSWHNLNTLCWAVGSISGAMSEEQEKNFLVTVIRELLRLVELKKGKDNKAVIASNIMYVVGQYPRFLRLHWRFLKTVINKLFEFMHEKHPGVQDMACDTFLKIAKKCRRKFVVKQEECQEPRPYIEVMLDELPTTIADLEVGQIHSFYEAMGDIIMAQSNANTRQAWLGRLMELPNQSWTSIITLANSNVNSIFDPKTVKNVISILKTNHRVATAVGQGYIVQLGRIYIEMLQVYKMYSEFISNEIATKGPQVTSTTIIRNMRAVKKEVLKLIDSFIESSQPTDRDNLCNNFLPALLDPILDDYNRNVPNARDSEVLSLFATIITKLGPHIIDAVPKIFQSLVECTLNMITKNFEDFPDHRVKFFNLILAINTKCFRAFFLLRAEQFKIVIDSVVWAFRHLERNIADTGLSILLDLLKNMESSDVAQQFFQTFFMSILQDIFVVLTDTLHKSGFALHAALLAKLFYFVESGKAASPLWPADQSFPNNKMFLGQYMINLIANAFPNLSQAAVQTFVEGLFNLNTNLPAFKSHLRDFLIRLKGFSADDTDGLYREESEAAKNAMAEAEKERILSVPGLRYQSRQSEFRNEGEDDDE